MYVFACVRIYEYLIRLRWRDMIYTDNINAYFHPRNTFKSYKIILSIRLVVGSRGCKQKSLHIQFDLTRSE